MTTEFTQYFRLRLPDFRTSPWHDEMNANTADIDSILYRSLVAQNIEVWVNDFDYTIGDIAIDPDNATFWLCTTDHTSAAAGTFAADRTANPTYWSSISLGIQTRGAWTNDTPYQLSDLVYDTVLGITAICINPHISSPIPATIETDAANWDYIVDISNVLSAATVSFVPAGNVIATNVQDAIEELDGDIDGILGEIDDLEAAIAEIFYSQISTSAIATNANFMNEDANKLLTVEAVWDAAAPLDLGNQTGTVTLDCGAANANFVLVQTGNVTIANPTSLKPGQMASVLLTQDGTGGRTISFGNQFFPLGGTALGFNTAAAAVNFISFIRMTSGVIVYTGGRLA